ncbi:MAG: DNA repair protein, partial [Acidimicrobiales bacterium]
AGAGAPRTAAMCSERDWTACHRRLLADAAVLARSAGVVHLGHDGVLTPHAVTHGARLAAPDLLVYDVGHTQGMR